MILKPIWVRIANEILMCFRGLKKSSQDILIGDPIDTDKEGNNLTLGDILADDVDIAEDIDLKLKLEKLSGFIKSELTPRKRKIIHMRYGLNGYEELPQREVAKRLRISRSYVSRIEKKALETLRAKFESEGWVTFATRKVVYTVGKIFKIPKLLIDKVENK